ncbi:hypothetical protein [Hymenobacter sp. B81]|uniref:hypothetical protein n=1 Tax=Hymenobacter sp. B81 TaxID=3344878 RepID=UPI0037DCCEDB
MYLRFTTRFTDETGQSVTGIFNAVAYVRDYAATDKADVDQLAELYQWFNKNLKVPPCFDAYDDPHNLSPLAWFKDSAAEHIRMMRHIVRLLAKYDVVVEMIHSRDPGPILYHDEFQVAAFPPHTRQLQVH